MIVVTIIKCVYICIYVRIFSKTQTLLIILNNIAMHLFKYSNPSHHLYQPNQQPRSIVDLTAAQEINDDDLVMKLWIWTEQWLWVQMATMVKNTMAAKASFTAATQSFLLRRLWLGSVKDSVAMLGLLLFLFSSFFFKQ